MRNLDKARVVEAEERLRLAQINSDVRALDELVSDNLMFTGFNGQISGKADELAFHTARVLRLTASEPSERRIQLYPGFAVVSVLMHLVGTYEGAPIDQRMRYTRVWAPDADGNLQIVAGHMSEILSD